MVDVLRATAKFDAKFDVKSAATIANKRVTHKNAASKRAA
jgi:hypothetical protein